MPHIQIYPLSPDDPISYFQIQAWYEELVPKFSDGVRIESDDGTNVIYEVKDPMMPGAEIEEIARALVGFNYNYAVY
jgi:hypothetical protein